MPGRKSGRPCPSVPDFTRSAKGLEGLTSKVTIGPSDSIFSKAAINVATFTTTETASLDAWFCSSGTRSPFEASCSDLQTGISDNVLELVGAVNTLDLDAKLLKQTLQSCIQSSIVSTTGLTAAVAKIPFTTLLQIVDAWISNDFGVLSGAMLDPLRLDVRTAADAVICGANLFTLSLI